MRKDDRDVNSQGRARYSWWEEEEKEGKEEEEEGWGIYETAPSELLIAKSSNSPLPHYSHFIHSLL